MCDNCIQETFAQQVEDNLIVPFLMAMLQGGVLLGVRCEGFWEVVEQVYAHFGYIFHMFLGVYRAVGSRICAIP